MRIISPTCAAVFVIAGCTASEVSDGPAGDGSAVAGSSDATGDTLGASGDDMQTQSGATAGGPPSRGGQANGSTPVDTTPGAQPAGGDAAGGNPTGMGAGTPGNGGSGDGGATGVGGMSQGQGGSPGGQVGNAGSTGMGGSPMGSGGTGTDAEDDFVQPPLVTSAEGAYWVENGALTEVGEGNATVTVDDTSTAQTWDGFGGSFNERGWNYLLTLSEADRNRALQLLFGRNGCNFSIGRIPMGSSDYGMDRYTLDEMPEGETDLTMENFSAARDEELLIPFIQAAQATKSDIYFWASPWSPPTWMKDGPFNTDSAFDGGSIKGDAGTLGALALYFVKFVQAYAEYGIDIQMVAPQNEPGYSGTYPTCAWAPAAYTSFVGQHLAPALAAAGLDTQIMVGTFNGGAGDPDIISSVMGDATAAASVAMLGYQWTMEGSVAADRQQYSRPVWQTEHKCGNYPWETETFNDTIAPNDHAYAVESWGLLRNWIQAGVSTYSTWNMVLDTIGNGIDSERFWPQNALLTVDLEAGTLNVTPTYYVFRHFAQFVQPGAVVVATNGGDAMAFKNPDGTIATVMYNSGAATPYTLAVGGTTLQFDMPGNGWATVLR